MERKPQTYANHAKLDEPFHFFLLPLSFIVVLFETYRVVKQPSIDNVLAVVLATAFVVTVVRLRTYPLKVQDRMIRLEERLRMAQVLPESLRARAGELSESQLVALRFASDKELPALVEKALANSLTNKQIKESIQNWRPDYFRV